MVKIVIVMDHILDKINPLRDRRGATVNGPDRSWFDISHAMQNAMLKCLKLSNKYRENAQFQIVTCASNILD